MDWLLDAVKEVGFPIAVASFVLVRLNGKMDRLTRAISELARLTELALDRERDTADRIKHIEEMQHRKDGGC